MILCFGLSFALGITSLQYLAMCEPKQTRDTGEQWVCAVRHGFCTERCREAFCYKRIYSAVNISVGCIPLLPVASLCFLFFSSSNSGVSNNFSAYLGSAVVPLQSSCPPQIFVNGKTVLGL